MGTDNEIRILAKSVNYRRAIELYVLSRDYKFVGQPVVMEKESEDGSKPTVSLTMDGAQELMDELWRCGLRPTEGAGSAGAMAVTQAHLKETQRHNQQLLDYVLSR